jgi:hypothetical protein
MSDNHLQNDPDRAGGLISDAVGEFVEDSPGGAFDPRTYRDGADTGEEAPSSDGSGRVDGPPMNDQRMVGPGEESAKAG